VLATVVAVVVAGLGVVLFVVALAVIAAFFVVAIVAALGAVAVRGLVRALSLGSGAGQVAPGGFGPASVIEGTATVIRRAAPKSRV
jgi:hypothetical protein